MGLGLLEFFLCADERWSGNRSVSVKWSKSIILVEICKINRFFNRFVSFVRGV